MKSIVLGLIFLTASLLPCEAHAQLFGGRAVSRVKSVQRGGRVRVVAPLEVQGFCGSQRLVVRGSNRLRLPSGLEVIPFAGVQAIISNGESRAFRELLALRELQEGSRTLRTLRELETLGLSGLQYKYGQASWQGQLNPRTYPTGLSADDIADRVIAKLQTAALSTGSAVERNCMKCHGAENPKKGFSVIGMTRPDSTLAYMMVNEGEMPKGPAISSAERDAILDELRGMRVFIGNEGN